MDSFTETYRRVILEGNSDITPMLCKALEPLADLNQYTKPFQKMLKKFDNKLARAQKDYHNLVTTELTEGWWRRVGYSLEEIIEKLYTSEFYGSGDLQKFHEEQGWRWTPFKSNGVVRDSDLQYRAPSVGDLMC